MGRVRWERVLQAFAIILGFAIGISSVLFGATIPPNQFSEQDEKLNKASRAPMPGEKLTQLNEAKTEDLSSTWQPGWAKKVQQEPNASYFLVLKYDPAPSFWRSLSDNFLDKGTVEKMRQDYADLMRDYDLKKPHDLIGQQEELDQIRKISDFSSYIFRTVLSYQFTEGVRKAEAHSEEIRTFRKVQNTVKRVSIANVKVDVNDSFKMGMRTDIPKLYATAFVKSNLVNVEAEANLGEVWKPTTETTSEDLLRESQKRALEIYKVSARRNLILMDVEGGLSYGGTTTNLTASLTKKLVPNVKLVFESIHAFDVESSDVDGGKEERFQVLYDFKF